MVDYDFYKDSYRHGYLDGAVSEAAFPYFAEQAALFVQGVLGSLPDNDAVKKAVCAIAEICQTEQASGAVKVESGGGVVASESVGSWSRSYATGTNTQQAEYFLQQKRDALALWLEGLYPNLFRTRSYRCVHEARK